MLDEKDPLESFLPIENNRPSAEELERIKKYSDENLETISSKLGLKDNLDDEEKRNIIINLIGALDYYIHEIIIFCVQITC